LAALQTNQNELQDERDEAVAELKSLAEANDQATAELRQQLAAVTENHAADKAEVLRLSDEIQSLQGKLEQATQAAAASSDADSDIEDLRSKFKLRVAQEHRKRKAAEAQTAEAEQQRNELAKTLKQLKAKLAKEKSK
jgi:chromosome segregation ATPase